MTHPHLTPAEQDVVDALKKGWYYPQICAWLGIAPQTARVLIGRVAQKLPPHGGLKGYNRVLFWIQQEART